MATVKKQLFFYLCTTHYIWFLENIKKKICSYVPVAEDDLNFLLQFYKKMEIRKGHFLVKPEERIAHFYYMEKGCVCYYKKDETRTKVMEFFTEGSFFTDLYAYIEEIPSGAYLEATEDSLVYAISKTDVLKAFDRSHGLERFGRLSMQDGFMRLFRRNNQLKNLSHQERYLRLLQKRPHLFQRVPQYLIASYLGLTPVGLSKIRKRVVEQ